MLHLLLMQAHVGSTYRKRRPRLEAGKHLCRGMVGRETLEETKKQHAEMRERVSRKREEECQMQEGSQATQWKEPPGFSPLDDLRGVSSRSLAWVDDIYPSISPGHLTHCYFSS